MENNEQDFINIINATENNLKHVSLKIPKKQITVFTGVSGSGKSSLSGYDCGRIEKGTECNISKFCAAVFAQIWPPGSRPHGKSSGHDRNRSENRLLIRGLRLVLTPIFMRCCACFFSCRKTFVGYSDSFSFNHPSGKCERCEGLGVVTELDIHKLVDFDKCLNDEGVIKWPAFTTGAWRWKRYAYSGLFDLNKKIKDYSKEEMDLFLYSPQIRLKIHRITGRNLRNMKEFIRVCTAVSSHPKKGSFIRKNWIGLSAHLHVRSAMEPD